MGHLHVSRDDELRWVHWHGLEDMRTWQANYGLPFDKYRIVSESVTVEQTADGMMISAEVYELPARMDPDSPDSFLTTMMYGPYLYPLPEGVGTLVDWDWQIPKKDTPLLTDDLA